MAELCSRGGCGRSRPLLEQDFDVLNGGDQPILNLHAPQPSPAGAFEPMVVGRIRETNLGQMLSSFSISSGGRAVRLLARPIQQGLLFVSVNRTTVSGGAGVEIIGVNS